MKKTIMLAFVFWLVLAMILSGCGAKASQPAQPTIEKPTQAFSPPTPITEPQPGGTLVISYGIGAPRHFNPALVSGSATAIVGAQIFASPLRYDENWNPQPYLAQSWEVSEDGLSVTLHLVHGATFHDGVSITSEDVAFSVMTVKQYHPFKSMFAPVVAVETPDPYTAIIRLSHPHPAILLAMSPALLPILPKHIYGDGQDIPTHPANLAPVGSGPFKFVSFTPGESIVLERYEDYFIPGRPYLDKIIFRLETSDPAAQVVALQRQEAQLAPGFIDFPGLDRLSADPNLIVTQQGYEGLGAINWLAFNLLHPPLNDKSVRQAIAYAINLDFIIQYLHQGRSQRATGPIIPSSPFYEPDVPRYAVDLEKARQLLDQAGYTPGADGTRFTLTLDYIPAVPSQQHDVALYIQYQLAKIGIEVQVRPSASFPEWAERIGNWDFDMTMDSVYNWGDPVIGVNRTYMCDNIRQGTVWTNTQNYCNPRVDELLSQAAQEMDPDNRKALYSEFQKIVSDELPIIWINVTPFFTIYNAGLGNPPLSIWGLHSPLDEVYWAKPPVRNYAPLPKLDGAASQVKESGVRAMALIQQVGLYDALEAFNDPQQGFLDMAGSGLHILGFTRQGIVFVDNSGQTSPGMDISNLLDLEGNSLLTLFLDAAQAEGGADFQSTGVWPNPSTNKMTPMTGWCGRLSENDIICALSWQTGAGGEE
jgi:peptide/nickel transport system substrate-binding protein